MPLGMEVGLGPGDFVLDGDHATPPETGGGAPSPPKKNKNFGPCLLWSNGWMDQDGFVAWFPTPRPDVQFTVHLLLFTLWRDIA